jgi:hypothetical protein
MREFETYRDEMAVRSLFGERYLASVINITWERPAVNLPNFQKGNLESKPGPRMLIAIEGYAEHVQPYRDAIEKVLAEHKDDYREAR